MFRYIIIIIYEVPTLPTVNNDISYQITQPSYFFVVLPLTTSVAAQTYIDGRHVVEVENFAKIFLLFSCCWKGKSTNKCMRN